MFQTSHPDDHPLRFQSDLLARDDNSPAFLILTETTAVRMDFSHSGWSDIFFLGMDFPRVQKSSMPRSISELLDEILNHDLRLNVICEWSIDPYYV
ncbi:MAG: hypothetical protein ACKVHR_13610 [Pirellulales bacterium]